MDAVANQLILLFSSNTHNSYINPDKIILYLHIKLF